MTRAVRLLALVIALVGPQSVVLAQDDVDRRDPYEILPPVEQYFHVYQTEDYLPAEVLTGTIEEELDGRWHIPIWDQYSNTARRVYGSGIDVSRESLTTAEQVETVARAFIAAHPALFGNPSDEDLRTHRISHGLGKWSILLQQTEEGIPVADAMLSLVFTDAGRLFAFGSGFYEELSVPTTPLIDENEARAIARSSVPADTSSSRYTRPSETVILPMLDTRADPPQMTFRLTHRIDVPTVNPDGLYETYVDALTGEIVRRQSLTPGSFSGTVKGDVEIPHPCEESPSEEVLPHLDITINGAGYTTGSDGTFSASGSGTTTYTAKLSGPYVDVDVDTRRRDQGQYSAIAVDPSTGAVSIAFHVGGGALDLLYAKKTGSRWSVELVDMRGDATTNGNVGYYNSIALVNGTPHVAYQEAEIGSQRLRYAKRVGGTWTWSRETIAGSGSGYGYHTSLKTSSGDPWIAYQDYANTDLVFAYKYSGAWYSETIDTNNSAYVSLAILATNGRPRVAYYSGGDLKYATRPSVPNGNPATWTISTVYSPDDAGLYASMAFDGSNDPHIMFYDATNSALRHAWKTSSWQNEAVDGVGSGSADVGQYASLAIGSDGSLHVAYYDATNTALKYVTKPSGGSWQTAATLDATGDVGEYSSIALNLSDRPRIAYYDRTNGDLKHAWYNGTTWTVETVEPQDIELTGSITEGQPATITFDGDVYNRAEIDAFYWASQTYGFVKELFADWWVVGTGEDEIPKATLLVDVDSAGVAGGNMMPPFTLRFRVAEEAEGEPRFSRARIPSMVAHEYGHGVNYWLADESYSGGAMAEGNAEICASFMTEAAQTDGPAEACYASDTGCDNELQYPGDVIGEDPYDGARVICGFNWDVWQGIEQSEPGDGREITAKLWLASWKNFGYSGYSMPDQVGDYWLMDDDNGNLDDDVPHGLEIQAAAENHGFSNIIWSNYLRWSVTTAPAQDVPANATNSVAMALDWASNPHIAYMGTDGEGASPVTYRYISRDCSSWNTEVEIDEVDGGKSIDIALPSNALPVVAYEIINSEGNAAFMFAEAAADWEPEPIIAKNGKAPSGIQLAIGLDDTIHVVFGTRPTGDEPPPGILPAGAQIWYVRKASGSWLGTSDPAVSNGGLASLAVANNGTVGICYAVSGAVKYATPNGSGWAIETVSGSGSLNVTSTAIAFDSSDNPHIAYAAIDGEDDSALRYVVKSGASWSTPEVVDLIPGAEDPSGSLSRGIYASLAVNDDGIVGISYHDELLSDLRYAWRDSLVWTIESMDRAFDTGEATSLAMTPAGDPVIAYYQRTDGLLKLAAAGALKVPNAYASPICIDVTRGNGMEGIPSAVPILRLCPAGDYDEATLNVTLKDILGAPMNNASLSLVELDGSVNIVGGGPTGTTNSSGQGQLTLDAASGSGTVGLCADGKILAKIEVRSPDVAGAGDSSSYCTLPTGTSTVNAYDLTNTECGFTAMVGPVVASVNRWWDLNGDGSVGAADTTGWLEGSTYVGGVAQHAGHSASLGGLNSCGGAGKVLAGSTPPAEVDPPIEPAKSASGIALSQILAKLGRDFAVVPNPTRGAARLVWSTRAGEKSSVEVFDVSGRRLRAFASTPTETGTSALEWDGRDAGGVPVASGVYFARLTSTRGSLVERFTLLR